MKQLNGLTELQQRVLQFLHDDQERIPHMTYREMSAKTGCSHQGFINAIAILYFTGYLKLNDKAYAKVLKDGR